MLGGRRWQHPFLTRSDLQIGTSRGFNPVGKMLQSCTALCVFAALMVFVINGSNELAGDCSGFDKVKPGGASGGEVSVRVTSWKR